MEYLDDEEIDEIVEKYNDKNKPKSVDVPNFLLKREDVIPTEEQMKVQAILNNVPSSTDIEKQNHLAELDRACQNWDEEEWKIVIQRAFSGYMFDELKRRMLVFEDFAGNQRRNIEALTGQKM